MTIRILKAFFFLFFFLFCLVCKVQFPGFRHTFLGSGVPVYLGGSDRLTPSSKILEMVKAPRISALGDSTLHRCLNTLHVVSGLVTAQDRCCSLVFPNELREDSIVFQDLLFLSQV